MGNLFDSVADYFTGEGWIITRQEEENRIGINFSSEKGKLPCVALVDPEVNVVFFHSLCPFNIPVEKRLKLAEFVTRVNQFSYVGSFLLNFDDGEIRFETYLLGSKETVDSEQMEAVVDRNLAMMNKHLEMISKVMFSDITPAEAVAEIVTGIPADRKYLYN